MNPSSPTHNSSSPIPVIELPASKSIGARFLVASYFASTLPADPVFDDCDDLRVMQNLLLNIYTDEEPIDYGESPLDCHASGTAFRFITAVCASTPGADFVVTGTPRLCERPMEPLLEILRKAGATVVAQGTDGKGPYRVTGNKLKGGDFEIRGDLSSQFISALMLSAPSWEDGMKLRFTTEVRSMPYIEMTAKVMEAYGVKIDLHHDYVAVSSGNYTDPGNYKVEADWSAAAFFYEATAITGKPLTIAGLLPSSESLQGDSRGAEYFAKLGVVSQFTPAILPEDQSSQSQSNGGGVSISLDKDKKSDFLDLDLAQNPDLLPALAVAAALTGTKFRFTGVGTLRHKESDRLEVMKTELRKLGYLIKVGEDSFEWDMEYDECRDTSPACLMGVGNDWGNREIHIDPHDDHRIAMAFAFAKFKYPGLIIDHPEVVEKSFSTFWQEEAKV